MSQGETLLVDVSVKDLFLPLINSAGNELSFTLNLASETYLLSLLEASVLTKSVFTHNQATGVYEEPMISERFLLALQEENKRQKCAQLKKLGDSILFKTGFFAGSLKRKLSGLNFHIQMGASIYSSLYSDSKNPVYEDLSNRFSGYVDLISKVGQKINLKAEDDVLMLFDRYIEGGSKDAASKLVELGCLTNEVKKASNQ